ncbi:MAG: DedA family protein [Candidatus Uhrbacteria bacterium]|nr:DedA family protein [Candidatus Uhrbacteria bacterium]
MNFLRSAIELFLHLDKHLSVIIGQYGTWTYAILFLIIFCETGLVITPFLPGDSLLFAAGTFAAIDSLHIGWLILVLTIAAVLGDTVNYWIGHRIGQKAFSGRYERFLKKEHLERTQLFYQKYGGKAIVLARFLPIIRTFAPFVAGIGSMHYSKFLMYNVIGGIAWVVLFTGGGYLFGNLPFVRQHFSWVVLGIIILSILMVVIEWWRSRRPSGVV